MTPLVIAHRGASGTRPENTLAAFRRAAELGAEMIELDVQLTRDGHVIVFHDTDLDRTTDGRGPVEARPLAEISALDAGRWFAPAYAGERVPTLAEVLAAVHVAINVELKPGGGDRLVAASLADAEAAAALPRIVFSSFDPALLTALRSRSPHARLAVLCDWGPIDEGLRLAEGVGAIALHVRKDIVTAAVVAAGKAAGLEVRAWTVNEPGEMRRLVDIGVTGIFSDFPERFLQFDKGGSQSARGSGCSA